MMSPRVQFLSILATGAIVLLIFRLLGPSGYQLGLLMRTMILMIVAIGLNILIGQAGLVSLGQAAVYGLGAYVAAWLAVRQNVPFLLAIGAAIVASACCGAILAYPTVRVRGAYFAVITIAFGLVFENILIEWLSVTGGSQGLIGIPRGSVFGIVLTRPVYFWVVAGCLFCAFVVQYNVMHSRYGRAMRATAQSETAARALGINLPAIRTLAFVISAALAGLAGGLYTFLNLYVNYETFTFFNSVSFLLMVILGGIGTLLGPVLGASILTYIGEVLQNLREWQIFAFSVLLAIVMFVMPRGIVGSLTDLYHHFTSGARRRNSGPWPNREISVEPATLEAEHRTDAALVTEGLTVRFGGLTAVDGVRLTVHAGTVHALIGPNGAGKSSLLNLISGFYQPTSGEVLFFGEHAGGRQCHELARRGMARTFQNTELFGHMSVLENVLVGFHVHYGSSLTETLLRLARFRREERAFGKRAEQLLSLVGLSDYINDEARYLPFGHQRRLEIARALALRPRLLLLDEPAAGLTHGEIEDLKHLIRLLADNGVTVVLVEHHVEMVMTISDHITVLEYGKVIASGRVADVRSDPRVVDAYFGDRTVEFRRPDPLPEPAEMGDAR